MNFDPTCVDAHVRLYPRIIVSNSHGKKVCGYNELFFTKKNPFTKRSMTPTWSLNPLLLRLHVWLYPRIIVSKSHENTSKYVDTVTLFQNKTWNKGHWPLGDLWPPSLIGSLFSKTWTKRHWSLDDRWPHVCWGHMCDCTQGLWKYINVCGYGDQFCKILHTFILRTYYVHTTYRMSDNIVSFWTKFRRDKKV